MRLSAIALTLLLVVACQPAGMPPPASSGPKASSTVPTPEADIRGDWRLARVDGRMADDQPPNGDIPAAIRLTVGDRTLRANSQCVGFAWRYEKRGDRIGLTPDNPGPMCARGLTTWESDFGRVVNGVTEARVVAGNLRLSGPTGELEFTPAPPPAAVDLTGEWVLLRLDGDQAQAGGDLPQDIRVAITADTIRAQSQCVSYWWRYRQSGQQLESTPDDPGPVCERTRTEWEQRFKRIIDDVRIGHLMDGRTMILDGAGGQAEFRRRN
jgi:hypothetical protein